MPQGPRGEKRPADVIGAAITVAQISVGDLEEKLVQPSGRVRSGNAGAKARSAKLSADQKSAIAKMAAHARWVK